MGIKSRKKKIKPSSDEILKSNKNIEPSYKLLNIISQRFDPVKKYFPIIITLIYFLCIVIGMYYHELWRDELDGYAKTFYNNFLKYNGPSGGLEPNFLLYYGIMHIILHLIPSFKVFQIYHLIIITTAIYIFNRFSNFNYVQKFLFTFSYFVLFEYGIISRWYGFFVLLLFSITYLLTRQKKNYILISILLLILANHNISAAIFSGSLFLYLLIQIITGFRTNIYKSEEKNQITTAAIIFGIGCVLLFIQYYYVLIEQGYTLMGSKSAPYFMTIRTIWTSYIPIPKLSSGAAFWNTNIFPFPTGYGTQDYNVYQLISIGNIFTFIMSILIILTCLFIFSKKLPILITFLFNTILYFVFIHFFVRIYFIRYLGLLFLIFVYCCWLYKYSDDDVKLHNFKLVKPDRTSINKKNVEKLFVFLVTFIFFIQFVSGILTYSKKY